jgi:zinc transporter
MGSKHIISSWSFAEGLPTPNEATKLDMAKPSWFHCQRDSAELFTWLEQQLIPQALIEALLTDDTRPRFESYSEGTFLIILRGINLNNGAEPDDMLSLRMLWYKGSLISTRKVPSKAVANIIGQLEQGIGPVSLAELLVAIIQGINNNITAFLDPIEEQLNNFEQLEATDVNQLHNVKSRLLRVRRYLKPQKYMLEDLLSAHLPSLDKHEFRIRNSLDTVSRINESIEFYLEQIDLFFSSLNQAQTEKMNKNAYLLSIIAATFIPAGFFTGLLGVNIGGIPGTDNPYAFTLFCLGLLAIILAEVLLLKKLKFT